MPITTTKLINHAVLRNSAADSQQLAHNSSFYRGVHLPWQGRFHFREGDGHEVSRTRKRPQPDSQSQRLWNFCVFTLPSSVRIKVTARRSRFERDPNLPTGSTAGAFGWCRRDRERETNSAIIARGAVHRCSLRAHACARKKVIVASSGTCRWGFLSRSALGIQSDWD